MVSDCLFISQECHGTYHSDSVMNSNGVMDGDRSLAASRSLGCDNGHVIVGSLSIASGLLVARSLTVTWNGRGRGNYPHSVGDGRSGRDGGSKLLLGRFLSCPGNRDRAHFRSGSHRDGLLLRRSLNSGRNRDDFFLGCGSNSNRLFFHGVFGL